jgi:hypothetical protein
MEPLQLTTASTAPRPDDPINKTITKYFRELTECEEIRECIKISLAKKSLINISGSTFAKTIKFILQALSITETVEDTEEKVTQQDLFGDIVTQEEANEEITQEGRKSLDVHTPENSPPNSQNRMCRYYQHGNCKKGENCLFKHPTKCSTFIKFGLKKFNDKKGCDGRCGLFHPKACFSSLKTKECLKK